MRGEVDDWPPRRPRALVPPSSQRPKEDLYRFGRLERAVSEISMQAGLHAQPGDQVHDGEQHDVGQPQAVVDRIHDCTDGSDGGQPHREIGEARGKDISLRSLRRSTCRRILTLGNRSDSCRAPLDRRRIGWERTQFVRQKHSPGLLPPDFTAGGRRNGALGTEVRHEVLMPNSEVTLDRIASTISAYNSVDNSRCPTSATTHNCSELSSGIENAAAIRKAGSACTTAASTSCG